MDEAPPTLHPVLHWSSPAPPRPLHTLLLTKPSVPLSAHYWSPPGDTTSLGPQDLPATFISWAAHLQGLPSPSSFGHTFPHFPGISSSLEPLEFTFTLTLSPDAFSSPFSPWASPAWLFFLFVEISPSSTLVSLVVQMVKNPPAKKKKTQNPPAMQETGFNPWVRKTPWRRAWQPTPAFLPGESHGQRSLVGSQRVGHDSRLSTAQPQQPFLLSPCDLTARPDCRTSSLPLWVLSHPPTHLPPAGPKPRLHPADKGTPPSRPGPL